MTKLRKMEQTKEAKTKYFSPLIDLLLSEQPRTREELAEILNASDREVRNRVAELSMHYPVIATSDRAGYRRAKLIENLNQEQLQEEIEAVEHQLNELKSRVACLKKKMKPLVAWLRVAEKQQVKVGE